MADEPDDPFSHALFEELLDEFDDDRGAVDFAGWRADVGGRARLRAYLRGVARVSPDSAPGRFAVPGTRLRYWAHAYNALLISAVLEHALAHELEAPCGPIHALDRRGVLRRLTFEVGGVRAGPEWILRERLMSNAEDSRSLLIWAGRTDDALILHPDLPQPGPALGRHLAAVAASFVSAPANLWIDHAGRRVEVTQFLFDRGADLAADLARRRPGTTPALIDYLISIAPAALAAELRRAAAYEFVLRDSAVAAAIQVDADLPR